ncbi:MAG: TIGR03557 family F420-dependent LLM class oxidoreductase [Nitrososphaerota archaeon]|nr:TIGR03557 family F420-dependent LLM class oxidoreductase [Candidatus Calditenuaceae archaeon]MDW8072724.1 TIGR03557 family F420-dependent LLM class oxidoreductase [Nitrososphaerota archaeon]
MVDFGYHVLPEWFSPERIIEGLCLSEEAGFTVGWISDHFHPWFDEGAHCSFAWSILSATAERTRKIRLGTAVTAPILRYNPAIVAQAFATLDHLYPGRVILGLGTGEALNEVPVGCGWPSFKERLARLEEAVHVIRLLWRGGFVNFRGKYYRLKNAKLYTLSKTSIPIYIAASGQATAYLAGKLGVGLITLAGLGLNWLRENVLRSYRKGLADTGLSQAKTSLVVEVIGSYDEDEKKALKNCWPFAATLMPLIFRANVSDPREIALYGNMIREELIRERWVVSSKPEDHIERYSKLAELGFNHIEIVDISPDHRSFIKFYKEKIIPYFQQSR